MVRSMRLCSGKPSLETEIGGVITSTFADFPKVALDPALRRWSPDEAI